MASNGTHLTSASPTVSREKMFLGRCSVVCLNLNLPYEYLEHLQSIVNDIYTFQDPDECVDFITNVENDRMVVILKESIGEYLIPILHDLDEVHEIYVYRENESKCKRWINENCPKYKGVFDVFHSLCQQIKRFIRMYELDIFVLNLKADTESSTANKIDVLPEEDFNIQEASFMYFRIISCILLKMKEDDPKDMIAFCRNRYADNNHALKAVQELEDEYHKHSSIWWYTKEGFLYKILNKALREQDAHTLYHLRLFINDLYKQVLNLFQTQSHIEHERMKQNGTNSNIITLYRGQQMNTQSFKALKSNVGGILSFTSFLSTTANKDLALIYAGNTANDENFVAVLFQLDVDTDINDYPFAKIDTISYFGQAEEEYLFAMGSIFRIEQVEIDDNQVWNIRLSITNEYDRKLAKLTEYLIDEIEYRNPLMSLGTLLWKLEDHENAKFFYLKALEKETDEKKRAGILQELGTTCMKDSQQALAYFHQSLEILQQHTQCGYDSLRSSIYNNIGAVYQNMGEYDVALVYLKESLAYEGCNPAPDKKKLAVRYNNIGVILAQQEEKDEGEYYLQQALRIALEIFPPMHPAIALHYASLAFCMHGFFRFFEAVDYQQKAVDIVLHSLPLNHPTTQAYQDRLKLYQSGVKLRRDLANMGFDNVPLLQNVDRFINPRRK